jgi:hypothetical protein
MTNSKSVGNLPPEALLQALQSQLPGLKTQAQLNAFMAGFDALRLVMGSIFQGDVAAETKALEALAQIFELARSSTQLSNQYAEAPEVASTVSNPYTQPPKSVAEYDIQRKLLSELAAITSDDDLQVWYAKSRPEQDLVISQSLRNVLFDAIRAKKSEFLR